VKGLSREELTSTAEAYLDYCPEVHTTAQVNELAARFHLPQDQFSRLFTRMVGEPPSQYLKKRQIERAKQLLRTTDWPTPAIAAASGFGTTTFFRVFRRMTGMTPQTYRRLHKT
jgi:AraC-like DNA-binding protein